MNTPRFKRPTSKVELEALRIAHQEIVQRGYTPCTETSYIIQHPYTEPRLYASSQETFIEATEHHPKVGVVMLIIGGFLIETEYVMCEVGK